MPQTGCLYGCYSWGSSGEKILDKLLFLLDFEEDWYDALERSLTEGSNMGLGYADSLDFTLARRYVRAELGTVWEVLFIATKNWFGLTLKQI
jgi:hypothetical protein